MKSTRWVIIDTETDGLCEPIHVVEISGQLMEGWEPVGEPFRMLLNHDVPISFEALELHGYTQEYLRQYGKNPLEVYEAFREYARDYPLVSHNLNFDWNRCLEPEWARLSVPQIGQRGFCTLMLARRIVPEIGSHRLEALKQCFHLTHSRSHQAKNDTLTLVGLFHQVFQPRLERAGCDTFNSVVAFSKRTPIAKCLAAIKGEQSKPSANVPPQDLWYYLDECKNSHGPFSAWQARQEANLPAFYIWREGMPDWAVSIECSEFLKLSEAPTVACAETGKTANSKSMKELLVLCDGLLADEKITTAEVYFLNSWLENAPCATEWPASEITQTLERILEDGKVSKYEKEELYILLKKIRSSSELKSNTSAGVAITESFTPISSPHFMHINLAQGTREWLQWRHNGIGASDAPAIMGENRWKTSEEVLAEKCGNLGRGFKNAAMIRGSLLEPEARARYIAATGNNVEPACLQSSQYDWLRASVDGLSSDGNLVVEIKCGEYTYRDTAQSGCVPEYYYGQLQHIMAVAGLSSVDFLCYHPGFQEILLKVPRDNNYIDRLVTAEYEIWQRVLSCRGPEKKAKNRRETEQDSRREEGWPLIETRNNLTAFPHKDMEIEVQGLGYVPIRAIKPKIREGIITPETPVRYRSTSEWMELPGVPS